MSSQHATINLFLLKCAHFFGAIVGWLWWLVDAESKRMALQNIMQSGLIKDFAIQDSKLNGFELPKNAVKANFVQTGKNLFETLYLWLNQSKNLHQLVRQVHGMQHVESALNAKKGLIFLTPHMGCFEITSIYYGRQNPITVLYRPPKLKWLTRMMNAGRARKGVSLAEANAGGVRKLMQALKRGEAIGILPDQIPKAGDGEWANFFGKPAYTMTLACKLAEKTGAAVIMAFGERLQDGAGFDIHLTRVDSITTPTLLNAAIEAQIAQNPNQYLWSYDRWKLRRHAMVKESL
jgi:Kdo2-lipid IVA lauroyltransferase/acyltransferase